jgi:uncharacterized membrane protein
MNDFLFGHMLNRMRWGRWASVATIAGVFILSFLLRFYRLGAHDFWYDEMYSVGYANDPWRNWNAPLYGIMLHFWAKIFGFSEFSLRFPSMLFNFFTTVVLFLLGKELFNKKTAILATLLMVLSPFHLWYAQEARDYAMVVFLGTLSSYILFLAIRENKIKKWVAFTLVSLAGIYTNYFYIFLALAQFLYVFYISKFRLTKVQASFLLVAGAFCFYIPRFAAKFSHIAMGFWVPTPEWRFLGVTLQNFMLGYSGTALLYELSYLLTLTLLVLLIRTISKEKKSHQGIIFCIFLFVIPIGAVFLFSKFFVSVYLARGLLLFSPYFYLFIACPVMDLRRVVAGIVSFILIGIVGCGTFLYFRDHMHVPGEYHIGAWLKKPVKPVADFLHSKVGKEDILALTNESVHPMLGFYGGNEFPLYFLFAPEILDTSYLRPVQESERYIPVHKIMAHKFKRMWVVSTDWGRTGTPDENSAVVNRWLEGHLRLLSRTEIDGLWIYCYEKTDLG